MKTLLRLGLPSLIFSIFAVGCHIENHHDSVEPGDGNDTCGSYCLHLLQCSSINENQVGSCLDQCAAKLSTDSEGTVSACECVMDDECRAIDDYDCPGAPMPSRPPSSGAGGSSSTAAGAGNTGNSAGSGDATSSGGATSAGGGSASSGGKASSSGGSSSSAGGASSSAGASASGGTSGAPVDCQGGYDCADDQDCVAGACRQRCTASCQCPTDLSCIDHYCRSAEAPPACTTDCECASGQHCLSGTCG